MPDFLSEKERNYQNSVIELFKNPEGLDYTYLGHFQYAKGASKNANGKANSPLMESELRAYLESQDKYTDFQIDSAIRTLKERIRLTDKKIGTLIDTNTAVYQLLVSGIQAKPSPEENEKDVMLFDFENPLNNRFDIAEEVSFIDPLTGANSRPDLVIYVNGIALAVIELKRSIVSIVEGIKQSLSNEKALIPSFFTTIQFTIAANEYKGYQKESEDEEFDDTIDGVGFKYGTIGTPLDFRCRFKRNSNKTGYILSDKESFELFFDKKTFITMFRYGVITDSGIKKVMRPHQLYALMAAIPRLETKDSGIIWHSQGSGKSLTMVWLAAYIKANFEDPRVLIITDRTELDKQLADDFSDTGNALCRATSSDHLLETLNTGSEWLICSLIQKFGNRGKETEEGREDVKIPLDKYLKELRERIALQYPGNSFSVKGKNIFVFIDECHRTQGGRLHEGMKEIMGKEVMLIGFTGTPLLRDDKLKENYKNLSKTSEFKFGTFIHKYLHKQAVEDKVILDLQYEARDVEQYISNKEKLDEKLESIVSGLTPERAEMVKDRWATLEHIYSSKERIERIGYSIIDDVRSNSILRQDWANAMLIAGDIETAYKYYDFFQNRCGDTTLRGKCAVVTSFEPTDADERKETTDLSLETPLQFKHRMALQTYADAGQPNAAKYEKWAKEKFVKQPARMKLMIVVDKLLTGFDAPCATFLYIDRYLYDHNLFQSICRVNRLGVDVVDENNKDVVIAQTHKKFGLIVDFKHLFDDIDAAIHKFNDENGALGGYEASDIDGLLEDAVVKGKKRLESAKKAYESLKSLWAQSELTDIDKLAEYYLKDDDTVPAKVKRENMYKITSALATAYDNLADFMSKASYTLEQSDNIEKLVREATHINLRIKQVSGDDFDPRSRDHDMRSLMDRFIRAEDAETIIPATADFSFLDLIGDESDEEEVVRRAVKAAGGHAGAAAEVIEGKARAVINDYKDRDPEAAALFSTRLQELLDMLKASTADFEKKAKELVKLIKESKKGGVNFPVGISNKLMKAMWNNRKIWQPSGNKEELVQIIQDFDKLIYEDAGPDWKDPHSVDAHMLKGFIKAMMYWLSQEQVTEVYMLATRNS